MKTKFSVAFNIIYDDEDIDCLSHITSKEIKEKIAHQLSYDPIGEIIDLKVEEVEKVAEEIKAENKGD